MSKNRLEAFSDGVIAIVITIMVLHLEVPDGDGWAELRAVLPAFLTYVLSFVFVGIYWNNHHHMMHLVSRIDGRILWANLHLLFWVSLIPFVTGWMGANQLAPLPTAVYGVVLLCCAVAWQLLRVAIIASQGKEGRLAAAVGTDRKGKLSLVLYASAIPLAFARPWASVAIYVIVSLMWLVPDRRIEKAAGS